MEFKLYDPIEQVYYEPHHIQHIDFKEQKVEVLFRGHLTNTFTFDEVEFHPPSAQYHLEVKAFFESLSREELISLLEESGFKVTDGTGQIIFEEETE
ncbi:hypothetical protein ACFYKX_10755 [Cytobacillus sp. FJAT-54145]|uniref:Uncharacterized protein n=1 Tax=Cytobacillus spartinae TaxID=3299023 RepID=A0ABW6KA83_9BACI